MDVLTLDAISKNVISVIKELSESNIVVTPLIYQKIFFEVAQSYGIDSKQIYASLISETLLEDSMLNLKNIITQTKSSCNTLSDITNETYEAINTQDSEKITTLKRKVETLQEELLRLERKLYQDKLTLAFNKQWIIERKLDSELKFNNSGILALVNLDGFSKVNDKYGYDVGNKILKFLAGEFLKSINEVVRFEGDEFLIFFDLQNVESVKNYLDRFRWALKNKFFNSKGKMFTISFSFGVCDFKKNQLFQDILDITDELMKSDKARGEV